MAKLKVAHKPLSSAPDFFLRSLRYQSKRCRYHPPPKPGICLTRFLEPTFRAIPVRIREHIDFVISGHTHGGQVVLPFLGAPYLPSPFGQKYLAGLVRDGERQTYVSRGLGLFFAPIRINCPPEVSVLILRWKEKGYRMRFDRKSE